MYRLQTLFVGSKYLINMSFDLHSCSFSATPEPCQFRLIATGTLWYNERFGSISEWIQAFIWYIDPAEKSCHDTTVTNLQGGLRDKSAKFSGHGCSVNTVNVHFFRMSYRRINASISVHTIVVCERPSKHVNSCKYRHTVFDMICKVFIYMIMYVIYIQPPTKDTKAKNDACQHL